MGGNLVNNIAGKAFLPDSTYEDTIIVVDDTVTIYNGGLDTIFIVETDSTAEDAKIRVNAIEIVKNYGYAIQGVDPINGIIGLIPGAAPKVVNMNLFGINVSGMFEESTLPYNELHTNEQWNWLSELRPETLRFPSGEYGEFAMLLKNRDGTDAQGYGFNIEEIYKY